jgi:hypothetical protein
MGFERPVRRDAFNAKVNIHRRGATPILPGIEDELLCDDERYAVTRGACGEGWFVRIAQIQHLTYCRMNRLN